MPEREQHPQVLRDFIHQSRFVAGLVFFCLSAAGVFFGCLAAEARPDDEIPPQKKQYNDSGARALDEGMQLESGGNLSAALERYKQVMGKYPNSPSAPEAQFRMAQLYERNREFVKAFESYQAVIDGYRESDYYSEALQGQFRLAVRVQNEYRKEKDERVENLPSRAIASEMFYRLIQTGIYSDVAADAQFYLGVSLEKEGFPEEAIKEHETMIERYPNHKFADDSAFQVGYIQWKELRNQSYDQGALEQVRLDFEYFLAIYPESDKAAEARHILEQVRARIISNLVSTAQLYEKQGKTIAAKVYYKEVLSQYPETINDERLARRIAQLEKSILEESGRADKAGESIEPVLPGEESATADAQSERLDPGSPLPGYATDEFDESNSVLNMPPPAAEPVDRVRVR